MLTDVQTLLPPLLEGLRWTAAVTVLASALAVVMSVAIGLCRIARSRLLTAAAAAYVAFFRGTSALVQLFWAYYALPLVGVEIDAFTAGVVVLGLNTAAYGAEVVRGAVRSIDDGQWRAGRALGFSHRQILWRIVLPQAWLRMIPPMGNLLIELLKNSSLVSMITLAEMTFQAQTILRVRHPGQTPLIFALLLLLYFGFAQIIAFALRRIERFLARGRPGMEVGR